MKFDTKNTVLFQVYKKPASPVRLPVETNSESKLNNPDGSIEKLFQKPSIGLDLTTSVRDYV